MDFLFCNCICTCSFNTIVLKFLCIVLNIAPTKVEIVNEEEAKVVGELLPNRTVEDTVEIDSKTPSTKITVTTCISLFSLFLSYMYMAYFEFSNLHPRGGAKCHLQ